MPQGGLIFASPISSNRRRVQSSASLPLLLSVPHVERRNQVIDLPSPAFSSMLTFNNPRFLFSFVKRRESSDLWIVHPLHLEDLYVAQLTDACGT